ncbi:MAG TPA: class I SAM-dependent methyltransferase [Lysobacter sp.]|nr:class I SAM-dependent methyltransferase [Lysobacter sp.]
MNRPELPSELPRFDDQGINIADPHDRLGEKTAYISLLQSLALERYVGRGAGGMALDVGCGYGRMSGTLSSLGWRVVGVDPSLRVLRAAARFFRSGEWCVAALPHLPFADGAFDLVLAQSLLRSLHLNGVLEVAEAMPRVLRAGGRLVVVDNVRARHPAYVEDAEIVRMFTRQGMRLLARHPIRRARWWGIYLIRYGLVPRFMYPWLALREIATLESRVRLPRWQYTNVMYVFEKPT